MSLTSRVALIVVALGLATVVHVGMARHLESVGPLPEVPLAQPLAELPLEMDAWSGHEMPVTSENAMFGDDYIQRGYAHATTGQSLTAWLVYCADGEDRGHHPEVCMAVAGHPEDPSVRQTLELGDGGAPIQQYRFGSGAHGVWVFYWHYTLPPPEDDQISEVQRVYQRLRRRPSSLTLEVFAPAQVESDVEDVRQFVRQLDAEVQALVGPDAIRGSTRSPVTVVEDEAPPS